MKAKTVLLSLIIVLLLNADFIIAQSQNQEGLPFNQTKTGSKIVYTPEKPKIGDSLTITFLPGKTSPVYDVDTLYLNMLYLYTANGYKADEYPMKKKDNSWVITFKIENEKTGCIALQFADKDFDKIDCNDEQGWDILIYDKEGQPVKGAYMAYSDGYMSHGLIRRVQDMNKYKAGLEEEYKRYPDDPVNLLNIISYIPKDRVKRLLDSLVAKYPDNKDVLLRAAYKYDSIKDTVTSAEVKKKLAKINPRESVDLWKKRDALFFKKADAAKAAAYEELEKESAGTSAHNTIQRDYFQTLVGTKLYRKAAEFIPRWKKPDENEIILLPARMLNDCDAILKKKNTGELASYIPLKEEDEKVKEIARTAIEISTLGIDMYNRKEVSSRPVEYTPTVWYNERNRFTGLGYYYMAKAHILAGNDDEAGKCFERAKSLLRNDFYSLLDESFFELLYKMKNNKKSFEEAKTALKTRTYNTGFLLKILTASAATPAEKKEADKIIAENKSMIDKERANEIKANYFKNPVDAFDFTLQDLNGKQYHLADMKGKIVILEFWDTYCGWCEKSLKVLNKFYIKHKNDKDIVFLTINIDPGENDKLKRSNVAGFMKANKYNFPALLDYKNNVISEYKLYGVPQTLVIGKDGKVAYKESGYGGETMAKDLEVVIKSLQ